MFSSLFRSNNRFLYSSLTLLLAFAVLTILWLQPVNAAPNIVVNSLADNTTSSDGFCTLREAITNANNDSDSTGGNCVAGSGADTITFSLNGTITLSSTLPNITSAITIDGTGHTIAIDGNNGTGSFIQVGSFYVDTGGNLTLNSLTIQNGNAGQFYGERGGAVLNYAGAMTATNVTFSGNFANQGGAIFTDYQSTTTTITNSTFTGNSANEGGAVYGNGGTITLTNDTFTSNTVTGSGGAIYDWGVINVNSSTLSGNSATSYGGAIYNYGTLSVTNSTISGNSADSGAGIYNYTQVMTITGSTLSGNTAATNGGGIYTYDGTPTITKTTLSGNSATTSAGAIYTDGSTLTLTSSTISGNTSPGGSIYQSGSVLSNAYFAGNILDTSGGANCTGYLFVYDKGYNVENDASCTFNIYAGSRQNAPLTLSPLALNEGGSTQTRAPAVGSAAIAVIPNGVTVNNNGVTLACNNTTTDQNGIAHPRIPNGACSSGAVEATEAVISCPNAASITTAADLNACFIWGNAYPGADTFTLGANITLNNGLPAVLGNLTFHGGGHILDGNHAARVFRVAASGTVNMDSITIQNGVSSTDGGSGISNSGTVTLSNSTISGNTTTGNGGGINTQGTMTLTNTTISGNSSTGSYYGGGGIYGSGILTISGSTISGNTSTTFGGGIYIDNTAAVNTLTVTGSTISGNSSVEDGGGIYTRAGTTSITSTTVSNNTSSASNQTNSGGGIFALTGTVTVDSSTFTNNSALAVKSNGGGIYIDYGVQLTVNNSSFNGNSAAYGGGILTFYNSTVENSTFSGNSAVTSGGGVYNGSTMNMFNTTLSTNSATYGGAVYSDGSTTITNTTISGNSGFYYGGGIYANSGGTYLAGVLLDSGSVGENCIVYVPPVGVGGQIYDNRYNLSDDTTCGFNQPGSANNLALHLGTLQNNGGPTLTQIPGTGSPALDRIPNGALINNNGTSYFCNQNGQLLDTDQRGDPRPSPASGNCDVGAVEFSFDFTGQKPVLVSPTNGGSFTTSPTKLVWNAVPTATSYIILMDANNPPTTTLTTVSSTSYTFPSPLTIGTYYWQVQAVDASSQHSALSNVFSFTVASPAGAAPARNFYTTDTPTLTWSAVTGASSYNVQVSSTTNFTSSLDFTANVPGSQLSVATSSLADGTHYWRVQACSSGNTCGAWSTVESFVVKAH